MAYDGHGYDDTGRVIGKLGGDGVVRGEDGSMIGGLGSDWYELVKLKSRMKICLRSVFMAMKRN